MIWVFVSLQNSYADIPTTKMMIWGNADFERWLGYVSRTAPSKRRLQKVSLSLLPCEVTAGSHQTLNLLMPWPWISQPSEIWKTRTSPVVQWIRIHLPIEGTWVQFLTREDSTSHRETNPSCRDYSAYTPEPTSHNYWAHMLQLLKPRPTALQREKSLQWEAHTPQPRVAPGCCTRESKATNTQHSQKKIFLKKCEKQILLSPSLQYFYRSPNGLKHKLENSPKMKNYKSNQNEEMRLWIACNLKYKI